MLSLLLATAIQAPAPAVEQWIALTKAGTRIECIDRPIKGALAIKTQFGTYNTPTDPVVNSFRAQTSNWNELLQQQQFQLLEQEISNLNADGKISQLVELNDQLLQIPNHPLTTHSASALETWGAKIDPLDPRLNLDQRIEKLWELVQQNNNSRALLFAGALFQEAEVNSSNSGITRKLSLKQLRHGLRDKSAIVRRTAARLCAKQRIAEPELVAALLEGSVSNNLFIRDAYAEAAEACWGSGAVGWWTQSLLRGSDSRRLIVVANLRDYAPLDSLRAFIFVLASADKKSGVKFTFDQRDIRLVRNSLSNNVISPESLCASCSVGGAMLPWPNEQILDTGSKERIRVVAPDLAAELLSSCIKLMGLPRTSNREQVLTTWLATR